MKSTRPILFGVLLTVGLLLAACAAPQPDPNAAKPSNPGGTGSAVSMAGNAANGKTVFTNKCVECHGEEGKGGVVNDGSDDGTVPALNPIDDTLINKDKGIYAANLDLFIQNGSTPAGKSPAKVMLGFGATNQLSQQDIADVIAYIVSLNPAK